MASLLYESSVLWRLSVSNNLEDKKVVVQEIVSKMREAKGVIFFDYIGINVEEATKMRKEFRENNVDCKVYKNTLIKIAAKECGYDEKINDVLSGSTAIAFGMKDPVAPAKIAKKYVDEFKKMDLKAGIVDGDSLNTGEFSLDDYYKGLDENVNDRESIKVVIHPNQE